MLTEEQGRQLLELARNSIKSYFSGEEIDLKDYKQFNKKQGVFVTLNKNNELRGCIGFPYPTQELYRAVFDAARAAAFEDPRFPKLEQDELKDIKIDISVLTVPEEITAQPEDIPKDIEIGKDGLIVKSNHGSGLLLPQVFTEYKCTQEQALQMTCQKAGLKTDAWKDESNKILKFQAQVFKEK
ncbi:AmmeMemoRadiSam system protein A [Candidatus Woesearchaeota archaeon]|nr:AmmeMemoRadiSam system protein A [Candidatus Woesearchaeota archaeon]